MFSFLSRKPALGALAVALVLFAGVVLAHRPKGNHPHPLRLSLATPKRHGSTKARWRRGLDLQKARRANDTLVQRLKDGTRIEFTLDPKLQEHTQKLLARYELPYAGVVAYDIRSGEVLVLAGHSARDPKLDAQRLCLTPWAPAASVYKLVTTSGLLSRGVPPSTSVCYHGGSHGLRASHLRDMPRIDTTCRTLSDAIAKSINPIIAKLATRYLNRDLMLAWSERYGFNKRIPFDFPVVPSRAEIPHDRLERARTAAGFWHTEMSVIHGAVIAGVPATGGILRWPHIIRRVILPKGRVIHPHHPRGHRILSRGRARRLGAMMARTTSPIGTGRRGFISRRGKPYLGPFHVAGKTGSLSRRHPPLSYSWFVGYAPVEKPQIAFAVLLGNPPRWRIKASAAARMFLADYLALKKRKSSTTTRDRGAKKHTQKHKR